MIKYCTDRKYLLVQIHIRTLKISCTRPFTFVVGAGCEYVVALTHMRTPNDIRLAESVPEIDLILGGHDHVYEKRKVKVLPCPN